jgi:hypothetical protein
MVTLNHNEQNGHWHLAMGASLGMGGGGFSIAVIWSRAAAAKSRRLAGPSVARARSAAAAVELGELLAGDVGEEPRACEG